MRVWLLVLVPFAASCVGSKTEHWAISGMVTSRATGLPIGGIEVRANVQLTEMFPRRLTVAAVDPDGGTTSGSEPVGSYRLEKSREATDTYTSQEKVTLTFNDVDGALNGTFATQQVDITLKDGEPQTVNVQM